jgi:hypothetical protein
MILDLAIAVVIIAMLIAAWGTIRKMLTAGESLAAGAATGITIISDGLEDTAQTYAHTVSVNNAKKRTDIMSELDDLGPIVSNQDIKDKLAGKAKAE